MYSVIMAGGIGTRFWPKSREKKPKQFLKIVSDNSMLRETFDRLKNLKYCSAEKIFIVANNKWKEQIFDHLPELPAQNYITEPSGKNTAPCIGLAATIIQNRDPGAVMGIFPSDHTIGDFDIFKAKVNKGRKVAKNNDILLTFGIQPTRPDTGYGYIKYNRDEILKNVVFKVNDFTEKPDKATAQNFLKQGNYLWNSGMFIWNAQTVLNEIEDHMSGLSQSLKNIQSALGKSNYNSILQQEWKTIDKQSIDYGIMEKSNSVYVIKSNFKWSDVGSWDSLYDLKEKDKDNNVILSDNIESIDTQNCLIESDSKLISTVGVEDLVIVQAGNATLIAKRDETQKVKDLVNKLRSEDKDKYL